MRVTKNNRPIRFTIIFIVLFLLFYYFNIICFSLTSPGGQHYNTFLASHLNYIAWLRTLLLKCSAHILSWLGYIVMYNKYQLLVVGKGSIHLVYTCGFGCNELFCGVCTGLSASVET